MPRTFPPQRRHRASSAGSYSEGLNHSNVVDTTAASMPTAQDWKVAKELLTSLLYLNETTNYSTSLLHQAASASAPDIGWNDQKHSLYMAKCLLDRCQAMDHHDLQESSPGRPSPTSTTVWQDRFLTRVHCESGYTPLHSAVMAGNLAAILLYLKYPTTSAVGHSSPSHIMAPMALFHAQVTETTRAVDAEGLTPLELLNKLQTLNLKRCRLDLQRHLTIQRQQASTTMTRQRHRSSSFHHNEVDDDDDDEFTELRQNMHLLSETAALSTETAAILDHGAEQYGFEVLTFGRPHHCALGVISSGAGGGSKSSSGKDDATTTTTSDINYQNSAAMAAATFRPQRVAEFAQERLLRQGSAVAVAAATHHTLVACRNGHLYVFGLNKGGRLGLGDDCPPQCPLPRRITVGALKRKVVKAIAAAENHSLCVTSDGMVFSWGSNQFGQLGGDSATSDSSSSSRSIPKQVDELKHVPCVAVAAGERHSVALSERGEVYVWGSNSAGQLGVARRSSGNQKVQRVEALWGSSNGGTLQQRQPQRKVAIAIAAADQSTLVLTSPVAAGLSPVNSVYWWGHGNDVPMRVPFDNSTVSAFGSLGDTFPGTTSRLINPVAIACGKYHNAAVTSDGRVYTWGTCSESLGHRGDGKSPSSSSRATTSSPQLVTGMLPENGGGFAVAISASEQHTAVVTDTGALFTWGVAHGSNVMGHKGVRWQPNPKRVPGVHRAVNVAVAKEHTVVLVGTTFPKVAPCEGLASLEDLSARTVARYVDLFNVIPILIMAEHSQCKLLIDYCTQFVQQNLDGVLNVGKKSDLNQYLQHMLSKSDPYCLDKEVRDGSLHPFVTDMITAGNKDRSTFYQDWMSSTEEWILGCKELSESPVVRRILEVAAERQREEEFLRAARGGRGRRSSSVTSEDEALAGRNRSSSLGSEQDGPKQPKSREGILDRIINQTANMDLSTPQLAEEKSRWLGKEIRSVRKKLSQISKLLESEARSIVLTAAEQAKVDRRPVLEAELIVYQTALDEVEKRIRELCLEEEQRCLQSMGQTECREVSLGVDKPPLSNVAEISPEEDKNSDSSYLCDICDIKCPDKTSFELHQNGRKHRNRLAQVEEEERQKAAHSIMAQKQMEQLKSTTVTPPTVKVTKKNPWGVSNTPQPKYKLPPPPHPVVPQVATPGKSTPSKIAMRMTAQTSPSFSPAVKDFSSILQEQEAASKKKATPNAKSPLTAQPASTWGKPVAASPMVNRQAPFHLHFAAPDLTMPAAPSNNQRGSYSLADFLAPPKPAVDTSATSSKKPASTTFAWNAASSPAATKTVAPVAAVAPNNKGKSFAEIQAEEVDFKKNREDRAYKSGDGRESKWFIERRERADSLHAIQQAAQEERETQLLIEEQLQIEAQIHKELAAQRKAEEQKKRQQQQQKSRKPKTKNNPPHQKKDEPSATTNADTSANNAELSKGGGGSGGSSTKQMKNNRKRGGGRKAGGPKPKPAAEETPPPLPI